MRRRSLAAGIVLAVAAGAGLALAATQGGPLPGPLPLFPSDNWWNTDVSLAPVDPNSASYISFIGSTRTLHPDLGGEVSPGSVETYGMPYVVVGRQPAEEGRRVRLLRTRATG